MLLNQLENAVRYSGDAEIQVHSGAPSTNGDPVALLSVHDEGIGLESADLDRIFDRFVHAVGNPVRGHTELGPTGRTTSMRDQVVFQGIAGSGRQRTAFLAGAIHAAREDAQAGVVPTAVVRRAGHHTAAVSAGNKVPQDVRIVGDDLNMVNAVCRGVVLDMNADVVQHMRGAILDEHATDAPPLALETA